MLRTALLGFVLIVFPVSVFGAPVSQGTTVGGYCYSGAIATPMDVSLAADWVVESIETAIMKVGAVLEDKIVAQTQLQKEIHENEMQTLRDLFVSMGSAQERAKAQDEFGEQARPSMDCNARELGAGIQVGKKTERLVSADFMTRASIHNLESRTDQSSRQWVNSIDDAKLTAEQLLPTMGSYQSDTDLKAARDMILLITNPYPSAPKKESTSQSGAEYEAERKLKEARLAIPQKALSDLVATHTPVMALGEWAKEIWQDAGGEGDPRGVVNGKISANALLDLLVDARFANPNWYDGLNAKKSVGLMREQLHMQATQLEILRRIMRSLEMIVALNAQGAGTQIQQLDNASITRLDAQSEATKIEN